MDLLWETVHLLNKVMYFFLSWQQYDSALSPGSFTKVSKETIKVPWPKSLIYGCCLFNELNLRSNSFPSGT